MNEQILYDFYSLGTPTTPPERVLGGLVHHLYRVRTTQGQFAIKLLSADALAEPGFRERLQLGERVAAAMKAAGLPAVAALEVDGKFLYEAGGQTFLVYPWIEGRMRSASETGPSQASQIGAILRQMHRLPLDVVEQNLPVAQAFTDTEWAELVERAHQAGASWAEALQAALPELARWGQIYAQAQQELAGKWALSHGDLHQQNVLWTDDNTPWIIDWESAGLQQPAKEAVVCALEWSGFVEGEPDLPTFRAFLQAYHQEHLLSTEEALYGLDACFGNWLGWLRFCAQRALDTTTVDPQARGEAAHQVTGTLATIRRVEGILPALRDACRIGATS